MARILPTDWQASRSTGAAARVEQTLNLFEQDLPSQITVFHGVHWSRAGTGLSSIGDIDFVVLAPNGKLLLIEQKSGFLNETEDGLVKRYRGSVRRVRVELDRTVDELLARVSLLSHGEPLTVQYLLYCPDYTVRDRATAGLAPEQIVDSTQREQLCERIVHLLSGGTESSDLTRRLHRFFANELELVPDASALVGRAESLITRMSEGLATWARRIEVSPPTMRVVATAGSGKTQLALALLQDASAAGRRALYVCYNRPLADHIREAAPPNTQVFNYHQWCQARLRRAGQDVELRGAAAFSELEMRSQQLAPTDDELVDMLIVDEGQDFMPAWRDDVFRVASASSPGRQACEQWWLEDPMQNLYDREVAAPSGWPVLRAQVNYRSPRAVVAYINRIVRVEPPIVGAGPVQGLEPDVHAYADADQLTAHTKQAITGALRAGFRRQDIAIITFRGRDRSTLHASKTLGPHRLRQFTGKYDLFGAPEFTDGDILLDTVYRFKGQSAPCVILTEVDFDALDDAVSRRLLVGLTRASLHVSIVCNARVKEMLTSTGRSPQHNDV